jgi:tetratricopeptide (TPR) repeat protein
MIKKSKIALKPYLDSIFGYCDTLSKEELTKIIIGMAKDVSTSGRVVFLEKLESFLTDGKKVMAPDTESVDQVLDAIEALRESIQERIQSIEDGSYWDEIDDWRNVGYDDEEPDYISDDDAGELESFFDEADSLFLEDNLEDARKVYGALFDLMDEIQEEAYFSPGYEVDLREARARYCRCVYETADAGKRLAEFVTAMEIDVFSPYNQNDYNEDYPMLQDVIDAKPGEMQGLEAFLPAWKKALSKRGTKARSAVLLLEVVNRLEGISGVSKLARKWKNSQPQGYLFWLNILKNENDQQAMVEVSKEGLKALKKGKSRERVAEFLIDAATNLKDAQHLLLGKRESFFSHMNDQNLLDLTEEALKQNSREKELDRVIQFFKARKSMDDDQKSLYIKTLLMSGKLNSAFAMAKKEKSVGWSYNSNAGVVFGSVLTVLAGHSEKSGTIKTLLKGYANKGSTYSDRISIEGGMGTSFYDEIIKGLKQKEETKSKASEYLSWAEKIGNGRIDHIVSNKHRNAYGRAAQVLGSLAETYASMGQKSKAVKILHKYYNEKYNRFSAFRREVKAVVMGSGLLRNSGFLT